MNSKLDIVLGNPASPATWYALCFVFQSNSYSSENVGDETPQEDGSIEPDKPREEVRQEPYPLPKDFEWSILDINDPKQVCLSIISHLVFPTCSSTDQRGLRFIISQLRRG